MNQPQTPDNEVARLREEKAELENIIRKASMTLIAVQAALMDLNTIRTERLAARGLSEEATAVSSARVKLLKSQDEKWI